MDDASPAVAKKEQLAGRHEIGEWTSPEASRASRSVEVGRRIGAARAAKGWTQAELAGRLGKSRGTIVQYEQGRIEPPLHQIMNLADILDVAPEFLAFGRQGLAGLGEEAPRIAAVPEVRLEGAGEVVTGAYGLPEEVVRDLALDPRQAKIFVIEHSAAEFGLSPGDRIIVDARGGLDQEDSLYALRVPRGLDVVRLLPNLSSRDSVVKINDGSGRTHSHERDELDVLGRVAGTLTAS